MSEDFHEWTYKDNLFGSETYGKWVTVVNGEVTAVRDAERRTKNNPTLFRRLFDRRAKR